MASCPFGVPVCSRPMEARRFPFPSFPLLKLITACLTAAGSQSQAQISAAFISKVSSSLGSRGDHFVHSVSCPSWAAQFSLSLHRPTILFFLAEWSVLYVIIASFLIVVALGILSWTVICCCKR